MTDGALTSNLATVTIIDRAPVAVDDTYTIEDASLTISLASLVANDTDEDGNLLLLNAVSQPSHGSLTALGGFGVVTGFVYTPDSSFAGIDTFTYSVTDGALTSNLATVTIRSVVPEISIDNVSIFEGDPGFPFSIITLARFTVSLSTATSVSVSVGYATIDNVATANSDYHATSGILNFAAGETSKFIFVSIIPDFVYEIDEVFFINLTNPTNATFAKSTGVGVILNDDPTPTLSVNDIFVFEGDPPAAFTPATFTVTLSEPVGAIVTVGYSTQGGTATEGVDYGFEGGFLTFLPGETTKQITVPVIPDSVLELNETFFLNLSNPFNATIAVGQGVGIIVNDDNAPPIITSNGGGAIAAIMVQENTTGVTTVTATDPDRDPLSFSIDDVGDAALFRLDPAAPGSAVLRFVAPPDFENPTDTDRDNIYNVILRVSDGRGGIDQQALRIFVTDDPADNNQAPVLAPIFNKTATVGQTVSFTATATDPDVPSNVLTFSLEGTVPAGASIDSTTGFFSWTPSAGQEGLYTLTVRVTDNGTPNLFAQRAFTVQVNPIATTVRWINPAGGNWTVASNWSTNVVPGAADDVIIDVSPSSPITFAAGTLQVNSLTMSAGQLVISGNALLETLSLSGGIATFDGAATITTLLQSGGAQNGAGAMTLTGTGAAASAWNGGSLGGSGTTALHGELNATAGPAGLVLAREFVVGNGVTAAAFALNGDGRLTMNDAAFTPGRISVRALSSFAFEGEADLDATGGLAGSYVVSLDEGAELVRRGSGSTTDFLGIMLVNDGHVSVQSGTLRLIGGSTTRDGNFDVAAGATLDFNVGDAHEFTGNGGITGSGTVAAESGFVKRGAGTITTVTPTVIVYSMVAESGTLELTGTVANNNGMRVVQGATLIVSGNLTNYDAANHTLTAGQFNTARFEVYGTLRVADADIVTNAATIALVGSSAQFLNHSTGDSALANFASNASSGTFAVDFTTFTTTGSFANHGRLEIGADGNLVVAGAFTNEVGNVRVEIVFANRFGRLQVNGDAILNNGGLEIVLISNLVQPGDEIQFMTSASRIGDFFVESLPPGTHLDKSDPTVLTLVVDSVTTSVQWVNPNGGFWDDSTNWSGGLVPGADDVVVIDLPGSFNIIHQSGNTVVTSLRSTQDIVLQGGSLEVSGVVDMTTASFVMAGGTLQNTASGNNQFSVRVLAGGSGTLDNVGLNGLVHVAEGGELTVVNGLRLDQGGELLVAGTVLVEGAGAITGPTFDLGGAAGPVLIVDQTGLIRSAVSGETLTLGPNLRIDGTGTIGSQDTFVVNQGIMTSGSDGTRPPLTVFNLANEGIVRLAYLSVLQVIGDFHNRSTGIVELNINDQSGDPNVLDVRFGRLWISGAAIFELSPTSTLRVTRDFEFEPLPPVGSRYQFMTFASRFGSFHPVIVNADIGGGLFFALDDSDPTDFELVVTT